MVSSNDYNIGGIGAVGGEEDESCFGECEMSYYHNKRKSDNHGMSSHRLTEDFSSPSTDNRQGNKRTLDLAYLYADPLVFRQDDKLIAVT